MRRLSQVLLIHYKRLEAVEQNGEFFNIKIQDPVAANPELYICGQKYDLVGVLVHQGESANSGHYYFDTVCPPYTTTLRAYRSNNDDTPELISMETLVADVNSAYMLAYQKAAEPSMEQPAAACVPPPGESIPPQHNADQVPYNTSGTATQEEEEFKANIAERDAILSIPNPKRSHWQHARYVSLKKSIAKDKDKFPHIPVKMPAMTPAQKKAAQRKRKSDIEREEEREKTRARMATSENKEKDCARKATTENKEKDRARKATSEYKEKTRARMATTENKEKDRARKATSEYKAADLQRKTAKKANVKVKARDGLKSGLILSGKFGVETNSLGAMDKVNISDQSHYNDDKNMIHQVCAHCGARHFNKETGGRMCCMDGKVVLPRIQKPTEPFLRLLFTDDIKGRTFKKYIRSFNNGLCLSSLQYNQRQFRTGHFKPIVIEGSVHQFLGPLI